MHVRLRNYVYNNKPIGIGSFAKVYKGHDITTKKKVAIKKINKKKLDKILCERLNMEIKLIKTYHDHKNIIDVYDVFSSEYNDHVFIILEYCECGDLSDFIENNRLGEDSIRYYMIQLRDGLKYLRSNNVIHRDLKPKNILLTNNYKTLKIADFGFAKTILDISLMDTLCGSPLYMAPEIMNNKKYNVQSDLWSVGVILYEMVYRRHPYGEPMNIFDLMNRLNNRVIEFSESDVSDKCLDLLQILLKTNADVRIKWVDFFNHPWFDQKGIPFIPTNTKITNKDHTQNRLIDIDEQDDLIFSMEMDNNNNQITKSNYCLDDILQDNYIKYSIDHIKKDGTLNSFNVIDKRQVPYVGSLPIEQQTRTRSISISSSKSILHNSLAYLSSSLNYFKTIIK